MTAALRAETTYIVSFNMFGVLIWNLWFVEEGAVPGSIRLRVSQGHGSGDCSNMVFSTLGLATRDSTGYESTTGGRPAETEFDGTTQGSTSFSRSAVRGVPLTLSVDGSVLGSNGPLQKTGA